MGNPTHVFFYREDVIMAQDVELTVSGSGLSLRLPTFIDACVEQAQFYAAQGKDDQATDILDTAIYQVTWNYTHKTSSGSLWDYGVGLVTRFASADFIHDLETVASKAKRPLSFVLQAWANSVYPRFPRQLTPFRLKLRSIARAGMFFVDREELDLLAKIAEPLVDQLTYSDEWKEVIHANASKEYDLALFYSTV